MCMLLTQQPQGGQVGTSLVQWNHGGRYLLHPCQGPQFWNREDVKFNLDASAGILSDDAIRSHFRSC